jgi:multiple sugar transport system substrate-binding protein
MKRKFLTVAAVMVAGTIAASLTACTSPDTSSGGGSLTVWTLEEQADRLAKAQTAADAFTEATGIKVDLVGVNEDQFPQLITAAAAAGDLPDIVGALPLAGVRTMSDNGLVNTGVTAQIVDDLDPATFSASALAVTRDGSDQLAVPSDGFPLSVIYRTDLFAAAGLPAPETYDDLLNAAETLNGPDIAGFVAGDSASTGYTQQIFEFFALANGCQLVDDSGNVTLDSPECVTAFTDYGRLVHDYTVPGAIDSTAAKTNYMGGKAAITMWASFILDEMAGLVADAAPTCPECTDDPQFIAKNSGFVTLFSGPDGKPVSGGDVTSWVVSATADESAASQFVEYFMNDGYETWLSQAPEGKFPTRSGTADDPQKFVDAWKNLETGVDTKAKLSDIYSPETLADLQTAVNSFSRWGFEQPGGGALMGAMLAELPVPKAIAELAAGTIDGQQAADEAQAAVVSIKESIG